MTPSRHSLLAGLVAMGAIAVANSAGAVDIPLGVFTFDSNKFGNTLVESDGGTFSASNWLNTVNADPGNPGYLTGANFQTGIANIGLSTALTYTLGYSSAIVNGAGADLGVVTARYSTGDTITLTINGATLSFAAGAGVSTGVGSSYFYGGGGPFAATLFVTSIDLSDFGVAVGGSISTIVATGAPELDLIRIAGFAGATMSVPEPMSLALFSLGLVGLGCARRMRRD